MRRVYYFCLRPIEGASSPRSRVFAGDRTVGEIRGSQIWEILDEARTARDYPVCATFVPDKAHTSKYRFLSGSICPGTPATVPAFALVSLLPPTTVHPSQAFRWLNSETAKFSMILSLILLPGYNRLMRYAKTK